MEVNHPIIEQKSEIPLDFLRSELSMAFARIWEATLGMPLEIVDEPVADENFPPCLGAVAWIGGSWTGNVRLGMPEELASLLTSRLLDIESPTSEQIQDAIRELVNMTAGNLKSVLPGRCGLATPGNFEINSLTEVPDTFSPILLTWYKSGRYVFFLSLSALMSEPLN